MAQRLAAAGPYREVLHAFLATAADTERSPFQPTQSPADVAAFICEMLIRLPQLGELDGAKQPARGADLVQTRRYTRAYLYKIDRGLDS
jgi:hypothetical protein